MLAAALAALALGASAAPSADSATLAADRAFVAAISTSDSKSATALLDQDFTWTTVDGATLDAVHARQALPKPAIAGASQAAADSYGYGAIGVIQVNAAKLHELRVWVKRPAGWRLLVLQDVRSLDAPATSTPGTGKTCENPCGAVPYTPKNATERGVMQAYSELEAAATGGKADAWKMRAADEIALVSSNSDRTFDKPTRAAAIAKATLGGVAPTKLLTARLFDFDNVVVMTSQHVTDKGQRLHITRVWVNRDGRWQETLSYQTAVR